MKYPLYRNNLCPKLWNINEDGAKLDDIVRKGLLKIAQDFVANLKKENNIHIKIYDIVIIGSITNYNWTDYSDIDLHVVTDFKDLDMTADDAQTLFDAIKVGWNNKHNITVKGHDVEIYVQDTAHVPTSASSYSVLKNDWIQEPKKENPTFNKELIKKKYKEYKKKITTLLSKHDEVKLKKLLEKLYQYRQAGLDKGGELSEENIVFKVLRALGHLDKLKDSINNIYDKKVSVKEVAVDKNSPAKQLIQKFDAPEHVQIDLSAYGPNTVSVESFFIELEHRGFGKGTETLKQLIRFADTLGVALELEIGADEAEIDLVRWYEKFGFKHVRGYWRREPKQK
jgi:GNAT superfamily N-acetyltransferase/predicted nucleotidyltransferase